MYISPEGLGNDSVDAVEPENGDESEGLEEVGGNVEQMIDDLAQRVTDASGPEQVKETLKRYVMLITPSFAREY